MNGRNGSSNIHQSRFGITWKIRNSLWNGLIDLNIQSIEFSPNKLEGWYHVKRSQIEDRGSSYLLREYYRGSLFQLLNTIFPFNEWQFWKLEDVDESERKLYWMDTRNQRHYFEWLQRELQLETPKDWYQIQTLDDVQFKISSVLENFEGSLPQALQSAFPEFDWHFWRFSWNKSSNLSENRLWMEQKHRKKFFMWFCDQLHVSSVEDLYCISRVDIEERGGRYLLEEYKGSVFLICNNLLPQLRHLWQPWRFPESSTRVLE